MLVLTRETGQPVRTSEGVEVGRLLDLTARHHGDRPRVHRLAVGGRRRVSYLVPWSAVMSFERSDVQLLGRGLEDFAVDTAVPDLSRELADDEFLLLRDVLDTQIVDVNRHRVARVADVLLERRSDGELEVVAVDVGFAGVCRRLSLARLSARLPERAIDWGDLHLTSERGHAAQLATKAAAVHRLDSRGLAELLTRLSVEDGAEIIGAIDPTRAAHAVATTHPEIAGSLLRALPPPDADRLLGELPAESAVRFGPSIAGGRRPQRRFRRLRGWRRHRPSATGSMESGGG